jgi:hypothetical protein
VVLHELTRYCNAVLEKARHRRETKHAVDQELEMKGRMLQ